MYVELSAIKEYLGIDTNDDNALLRRLLERAQVIFEGQTGRVFEVTEDSTRYFDAYSDVCESTLYLNADLCSITTITNGNGEVIGASNYVTEPRNSTPYYAIRLKRSAPYQWMTNNSGDPENAISIAGKWAYSLTPPADVVDAVIDIASVLYRKKDNASDYGRTVVTPTSTILPGGVSSTTISTIKRYGKKL